jgi:hypothetical protein
MERSIQPGDGLLIAGTASISAERVTRLHRGLGMRIKVGRIKRQDAGFTLKEDLRTLRSAIDSYTMDKQKAPQSLDDLLQDGYLKSIPEDPMTRSTSSWVTDTSDSMHSLDQTDPGIDDIHSGSDETGSDGQAYNTW